MSHIRTSNNIDHHSSGSSRSRSLTDDEDTTSRSQEDSSSQDNDDSTWADDFGEVDPSDSASAADLHHPSRSHKRVRVPLRRHTRSQHRYGVSYHPAPTPRPTMSTDPSEDYVQPYGRSSYGPNSANAFYNPHPPQAPNVPPYPQSHVGYVPSFAGRGNAMVHMNGYQNPFNPVNAGGAGGNYYGDPRNGYDMVPFQPNWPAHGYPMGPPVPQYMYASVPPPPPTEIPAAPHTPAPPAEPKPDPEKELMKQKLELLEAERRAQEKALEHKQMTDQIMQKATLEMERKMEQQRKDQEAQAKELERARKEAEQAARERMEAEMKMEEERRKQQLETLKRIEQEARAKVEAERRAEDERKKREAEIAAAAEAALKAKMEAAEAAAKAKVAADFKADMEAKEAAEKKVKEEIEWRKQLEEEAKLKAEIAARTKLEEERKKEEEAKVAAEEQKKADKALREKLLEEAKSKLEEAKKKQEKAPIRFTDAVGRKFSFPFHLCQTWSGMEDLIKQAFVQIEGLGPHVQEGHYDLIGPKGEIILPSIWEKIIEPDWAITMKMWPMDKVPLRNQFVPGFPGGIPMNGRHHMHGAMPPGRAMPNMPFRPGQVPAGAGPPRPPWGFPGMPGMMPNRGPMPHGVPPHIVNGEAPRRHGHEKKKGSSSKSGGAGVLSFLTGKPAKSSKKTRS